MIDFKQFCFFLDNYIGEEYGKKQIEKLYNVLFFSF